MATTEQEQLAALKKMAAIPGTFVVNDTTLVTMDFSAIYIAEDTVISNLYINDTVGNNLSRYVSTPGTAVKGGVIITFRDGKFSAIQLTSGSVSLILL